MGKDPRMLLNEMRQVGLIEDFGYELVERRGPSHQPTFVITAWAQTSGGGRVQTDTVSAGARKSAEREAAQLLYEALAAGTGAGTDVAHRATSGYPNRDD